MGLPVLQIATAVLTKERCTHLLHLPLTTSEFLLMLEKILPQPLDEAAQHLAWHARPLPEPKPKVSLHSICCMIWNHCEKVKDRQGCDGDASAHLHVLVGSSLRHVC